MMKPQRPSADSTRRGILDAAKAQFLTHGFDGTSIQKIAKDAKVNTNLIFHHFQNKATLWTTVKADILATDNIEPHYNKRSAMAYFNSIIDYRFKLYRNNPDLAHLIRWQQVSDDESLLIGNDFASPNHWLADLAELQQRGELRDDIQPELMMLFIIYSSYAPFLQHIIPLTAKQQKQYQEILLQSCIQQFVIGKHQKN